MGLINHTTSPVTETPSPETEATKKKSNSEYQKKQRELAKKFGLVLKEHFNGTYPNDSVKEAVEFFAKEPKARGAAQVDVFAKMFGENAKVGDKVGALEMLKRTNKNFSQVNALIAKWAEKGRVVKFDEDKLEYTIVSL